MFGNISKYATLAAFLIGTLLSAFGVVSAYAENSASEAVSISVAYGDLDLNSAAGIETLYERLRGAARAACDYPYGKRISEILAYRACYSNALQDAVSSFNLVRLTALHEKTGNRAS